MNMMISMNEMTLNGAPVRSPLRSAEMVAADLLKAKKSEDAARAARIELETELIGLLGIEDEGSKTHNIDGFKVVVKATVNRKVDWRVLDTVIGDIPEALRPVKTKRELDETGVKYLKNNEPEIYARIAPAITATPGKPGVTVTRAE